MTLLGKIFTVLTMVMSVLFMGFAIMVYATHTNWKMLADNTTPSERFPELGLKQRIEQLQEVNKQVRAERDKTEEALAMERAARQSAIAALQTQLNEAAQELATGRTDLENLQAAHSESVVNEQTTQTRLAQLTDEVMKLRAEIRDTQLDRDTQFATVVALTDELNAAEGVKRDLNERMDQLTMQASKQKRVLDAHGLTEDTPTAHIPPSVEGVVIAVSESDLIEISLGSDDGLRVGHHLDVYRDRSYLGRVVVRRTLPDRAVVQIMNEYRKGLIKKGDSVATKLI